MLARLLLILLVALPLTAQTTLPELETRLIHQPLYLAGLWHKDKLSFDGNGALVGNSTQLPFTLAGIDISELKLDTKGLRLDGKRVGLVFDKGRFVRTLLGNSIRIDIASPPGGDYTAALDHIFFTDIYSFTPFLTPIWQSGIRTPLFSIPRPPSIPPFPPGPTFPELKHVGGSVTPPVILNTAEPHYNTFARAARLSGKVLVYLQVNEQGLPQNIRILLPLGLGLDEEAAYAVSQYKFKPAKENGVPVPIELNIEVLLRDTLPH